MNRVSSCDGVMNTVLFCNANSGASFLLSFNIRGETSPPSAVLFIPQEHSVVTNLYVFQKNRLLHWFSWNISTKSKSVSHFQQALLGRRSLAPEPLPLLLQLSKYSLELRPQQACTVFSLKRFLTTSGLVASITSISAQKDLQGLRPQFRFVVEVRLKNWQS